MKLATYNVNGINGRLEVLLRWLAEAKPDVVCLQELKAPNDKFPRREIERAGYGAIWHGQKSWNGVAILAKIRSCARHDADCREIATTATAAISRLPLMASSLAACIFRTAIQHLGRSLIINFAGSSACTPMPRNCSNSMCR